MGIAGGTHQHKVVSHGHILEPWAVGCNPPWGIINTDPEVSLGVTADAAAIAGMEIMEEETEYYELFDHLCRCMMAVSLAMCSHAIPYNRLSWNFIFHRIFGIHIFSLLIDFVNLRNHKKSDWKHVTPIKNFLFVYHDLTIFIINHIQATVWVNRNEWRFRES